MEGRLMEVRINLENSFFFPGLIDANVANDGGSNSTEFEGICWREFVIVLVILLKSTSTNTPTSYHQARQVFYPASQLQLSLATLQTTQLTLKASDNSPLIFERVLSEAEPQIFRSFHQANQSLCRHT
jgi:hypothetical protein